MEDAAATAGVRGLCSALNRGACTRGAGAPGVETIIFFGGVR